MTQRLNAYGKDKNAAVALQGLAAYLAKSDLEKNLLNLIYFRVSQINGCAYCLDMHSKDLRASGESEQRLYMLNAWRDSPVYTARERAALGWAEALTRITGGSVPDDVYNEVCGQFTENEVIDLTLGVVAINSYNRINIAFRPPAGDYEPGQYENRAE